MQRVSAWVFNSGFSSAVYLSATMVLLVPALHLSATAAIAVVAWYWMMYVVDRLKPAPEDVDDGGAASFMRERRIVCLVLLAITVAAQIGCYVAEPRLALAAVASMVISLAYLTPIPGLGKRVKELPGCKPPYLGITVAVITGSFAWADGSMPTLVGAVLVAINVTVNTATYDLKDQAADRRAGLRTLAMVLGDRFFPTMHMLNTAMAVLAWLFAPPSTAVIATILWLFYDAALVVASRRPFGSVMSASIDAGSAAILLLAWFAG